MRRSVIHPSNTPPIDCEDLLLALTFQSVRICVSVRYWQFLYANVLPSRNFTDNDRSWSTNKH
jgi:hypothetical protein